MDELCEFLEKNKLSLTIQIAYSPSKWVSMRCYKHSDDRTLGHWSSGASTTEEACTILLRKLQSSVSNAV